MSFGPDQIAFVVFVVDADQFLELLLRLFKFVVSEVCVAACARHDVSARRNSTQRASTRVELALVDFGIDFIGASVRALRVLSLCLGSQLRVVGLLREGVEQQKADDSN